MVSPNYRFVDVDGNLEGGTTFEWYRSDVQNDPNTTYTAMAGETGPTYTVGQIDDGYYFKVLVTPVADGGITSGVPVWFGPSPVVWAPLN